MASISWGRKRDNVPRKEESNGRILGRFGRAFLSVLFPCVIGDFFLVSRVGNWRSTYVSVLSRWCL